MKTVKLEELIGEHILTGVDFSTERMTDCWGDGFEDCEVINFVLDGKTYSATQNPDDGWRSSMGNFIESDIKVSNMFPPCTVNCKMKGADPDFGYGETRHYVLEMTDTITNKLVLEVGTADVCDWYPCWVAHFSPENMAINSK